MFHRLKCEHVTIICALLLIVSLFLGCGGGGGGGNSASSTSNGQTVTASILAATGRVVLPAGFKLSPASLTVRTGIDSAPVSANGTFSVRVIGGGPSIATVENSNGNVVLMGYVDGAASGSPQAGGKGEISPAQCAIALLFFSAGAWDVSPSNWQTLRTTIGTASQTAQLASVISTRLAADPLAVSDGDPQVTAALQQAAQAIGPPASKAAASASAGRQAAQPSRAAPVGGATVTMTRASASGGGIIIDPSSVTQSGVDVIAGPDNAGVVFINEFRRRCTAFVYETAAVDANGNSVVDASTLPKPINVPQQGVLSAIQSAFQIAPNPQPSFEIGTSNALNGVFGSVVDAINNQSGFTQASTPELSLPLENGAAKTTYRIIVVGPALTEQNQVSASALATTGSFAQFAPQWQRSVNALFDEEVLLDGVLPLFSAMVFGEQTHVQLGKLNLNANALAALQELADAMAGSPDVNTAARNGDYAGALKSTAQLIADSAPVQQAVAKWLLSQVVFTGPSNLIVPQATALEKVEQQLSRFSNWSESKSLGTFNLANVIAYADAILFGLDLTAIIHDDIASFPAVAWDVTRVGPPVSLTPAKATVDEQASTVALTVALQGVTDLSPYRFQWSTTGNFGRLETPGGGALSTSPVSNSQIVYAANLATFKNGQQDTVTVQVFLATDLTNVIGSATATVTEDNLLPCGALPPPVASSGPGVVPSGAGNITLTTDKSQYHAGDTMTVTMTVAGGNTSQQSWDIAVQGANGSQTLASLVTIDGQTPPNTGSFDTGPLNLKKPGHAETHVLTFKINTPLDSNGNPTNACAVGITSDGHISGPDVIAQVFGEDGQINSIVFFDAGP